ncbi:hypothetical protein BD414DRAFT_513867 [Trametes punicea]|nr:hypothetical protein BD414DRAFT_513867 [Trametes punicea]
MTIAARALNSSRSTLLSGIIAFFLESFFFGAFTVVYGITVWILLGRGRSRGRSTRDLVLLVASTAMFLLTLAHVSLDLVVNTRTFLLHGPDLQAAADTFDMLNSLADPIGAIKSAIYVTQTLIGDGFMIYRAYVVWDRSWRVIVVPTFILFADVVLGYVTSCLGDRAPAGCVNAFFVWSFVTNVVSSALIMKRILSSQAHAPHQLTKRSFKSIRRRVIESLFQSAAIYSVGSVSLAVTSFISPRVGFTACHSVFTSIIGLVFVLIVIRISLNADSAADVQMRAMHQSVAQAASCASLGNVLEPDAPERFPSVSPPIAIKVSVSTTSDMASVASSDGSVVLYEDADIIKTNSLQPWQSATKLEAADVFRMSEFSSGG